MKAKTESWGRVTAQDVVTAVETLAPLLSEPATAPKAIRVIEALVGDAVETALQDARG